MRWPGRPPRLDLRDAFLNPLRVGGADVEVALVSSAGETQFVFGTESLMARTTDLGNGSYLCTYTAATAGRYVLRASLLAPGLNATYYSTPTVQLQAPGMDVYWTGDVAPAPLSVSVEAAEVDLDESSAPELLAARGLHPPDQWAAVFSGLIRPPTAGLHRFSFALDSSSSVVLHMCPRGGDVASADSRVELILEAGSGGEVGQYLFAGGAEELRLEYLHGARLPLGDTAPAHLALAWSSAAAPPAPVPPAALLRRVNITHTSVWVAPAALSPRRSTVAGVWPTPVAGAQTAFTVQARDAFDNALDVPGTPVALFGLGSGAVLGADAVLDRGDSTYTVLYTPTAAGALLLFVAAGCCPPPLDAGPDALLAAIQPLLVTGAPLSVVVAAAHASPAASIATVPASVVAGRPAAVTVRLRDPWLNAALCGDAVVSLTATGASGGTMVLSESACRSSEASVQVVLTVAGGYALAVALDALPVRGSPFAVTCVAAAPAAAATLVRGLGARSAVAGRPAHFEVTVRDSYLNVADGVAYRTGALLARLRGPRAADGTDADVGCAEGVPGVFGCAYTPSRPGEHLLDVLLLTGGGLLGEYYSGSTRLDPASQLAPTLVRVDAAPALDWTYLAPSLAGEDSLFSVAWTGFITVPVDEQYSLTLQGAADCAVYLDDRLVSQPRAGVLIQTALSAGSAHAIRVLATGGQRDSGRLVWRTRLTAGWTPIPTASLYYEGTAVQGSPFTVGVSLHQE